MNYIVNLLAFAKEHINATIRSKYRHKHKNIFLQKSYYTKDKKDKDNNEDNFNIFPLFAGVDLLLQLLILILKLFLSSINLIIDIESHFSVKQQGS